MFLGHIGLALGAKRVAPRTSLGTLLIASQLLDAGWAVLLAARLDHQMAPVLMAAAPAYLAGDPISHALRLAAVAALVFALGYLIARRYLAGALAVGALVLSHWLLDLPASWEQITLPGGLPPLLLHGPIPTLLLLESGIFLAGVTSYLRATRARDLVGKAGLAVGLVVLLAVFGAALFAPLPLDDPAFVLAVLGTGLFAPLGFWIERHREPVTAAELERVAPRPGARSVAA